MGLPNPTQRNPTPSLYPPRCSPTNYYRYLGLIGDALTQFERDLPSCTSSFFPPTPAPLANSNGLGLIGGALMQIEHRLPYPTKCRPMTP